MSDIKILQVDIQGMDRSRAREFCELLQSKIGEDIILVACMGSSGRINAINGADVVILPNGSKITGNDIYDAVMELKNLREENEDLRIQLNELSNEFIKDYSDEDEDD